MCSADCVNVSEADRCLPFNVRFVPNFYPEDRGRIFLRNVGVCVTARCQPQKATIDSL